MLTPGGMDAGRVDFLDLGAVNEPWREEAEEAALRVIRSGRYIGGPECERFEEMLAAATTTRYAVGVSSGLDALRLILRAWVHNGRLREGDEVIVQANTYIASMLAIVDAGLRIKAVEPDPDTMNLDASLVEKAITPGVTRAIMPVHLYGRPCWDEALRDVIERHGLLVIEDNAQAIGATAPCAGVNGTLSTGSLGHAAAFSFYPTKNVGAMGDAGAVTTNDAELAATVRALANYGSDRRYHNIMQGFNCRLDPMQAAILAVKLPHLPEITERRRANARAYAKELHTSLLLLPEQYEGHVWHQYVVRVKGGEKARNAFRNGLAAKGITTDVHYAVPPHRQPCMQGVLSADAYPVTDMLAGEVVSLPIAESLREHDLRRVIDAVNSLPE